MARKQNSSAARTPQATADSYDNFMARVGMQQQNQHAASSYRANFTSRNGYRLNGLTAHRPSLALLWMQWLTT